MRTLTLFCYVRREKRGIQGTSESVERITAQVRGEEETCLRELSLGLTSRKRKIAANKGFLGSESLGTPFLYLRPRAIKTPAHSASFQYPRWSTTRSQSLGTARYPVLIAFQKVRQPKTSQRDSNVPRPKEKSDLTQNGALSTESEKLYTVQAKVGSYVDATPT
jgi:hypothetical protein